MRPEEALTSAQKRVLDFVRTFIETRGVPPTVREIAEGLGFSSLNSVACHLRVLQRKGYLVRLQGKSRGILWPSTTSRTRGRIPILGRIAAGKPVFAQEDVEGYIEADPFLVPGDTKDIFVLRVQGDSMVGRGILDGDFVIVRRQSTAKKGDVVVALIEDEATVKEFWTDGSGKIRLIAANPLYPPIEIELSSARRFEIIGVVIGLFRRF